jgi:hypothetical protein
MNAMKSSVVLSDRFAGRGVSVAVPSLRIDSYEGEYASV